MSEVGTIEPVSVWALVPVKSPIWAKTRLASRLSQRERALLQWAMLKDVLDQLKTVPRLTGIAIVCPDASIQAMAKAQGIRVFGNEPKPGGLNSALRYGTESLREAGADLVAILPGDVPLLCAVDIDNAIMQAIEENATVVVPDHYREGTNALIFWADRAPRFAFGKNSFRRHLHDPKNAPVCTIDLPSVAHDVDWPNDLDALSGKLSQGVAPCTSFAVARCARVRTPALMEDLK